MNKILGFKFPTRDNKTCGLYIINSMKKELLDFYIYIAERSDNELHITALRRERVMDYFNISKATYYNKLNKLVSIFLIVKEKKGIYRINTSYGKVLVNKEKELDKIIKEYKEML